MTGAIGRPGWPLGMELLARWACGVGPAGRRCYLHLHAAGWSSLVARRAHNPKVVGSNPTPATIYKCSSEALSEDSERAFLLLKPPEFYCDFYCAGWDGLRRRGSRRHQAAGATDPLNCRKERIGGATPGSSLRLSIFGFEVGILDFAAPDPCRTSWDWLPSLRGVPSC